MSSYKLLHSIALITLAFAAALVGDACRGEERIKPDVFHRLSNKPSGGGCGRHVMILYKGEESSSKRAASWYPPTEATLITSRGRSLQGIPRPPIGWLTIVSKWQGGRQPCREERGRHRQSTGDSEDRGRGTNVFRRPAQGVQESREEGTFSYTTVTHDGGGREERISIQHFPNGLAHAEIGFSLYG